ncbi:MAG TPA: two-component system response regulator [Elusimicrobia bacterium]|nr:two-component system response regulator [Elusimicrobiota bacterium]
MESENTGKIILVVDDEPDIVFVLTTALKKNGYRTEEAFNGLEALKKIREHAPDAVIMDIMMPKLDGHSVNLQLKKDPQTALIPVIIITGKGRFRELLDIQEGVNVAAYLEKPFPIRVLLEKLRNILSGP